MKYIKYIVGFSLGALLFVGLATHAQTIPSVSPFLVDALGNITQRISGTPVKINGNLTVTGTCTGCGGGGGGGGTGTLSTSTTPTIGQLAYFNSPSTLATIATSSLGLLTTNVSEGTNLYFTTARAQSSISAGTGIGYSSGVVSNTGVTALTTTYPLFSSASTGSVNIYSATSSATSAGVLSPTDWSTFNSKQAAGNYITALTGDLSASGPGSVSATLATVNTNTGSYGSSTAIPSFTVNGKGLITAASTNAVIAPAGTLSGTTLASGVVSSSLTSLGTLGSLAVTGTGTLGSIVSNNLTASTLIYANASKVESSATIGTGLTLTSGTLANTGATSLTTTGTSGAATLVSGVLNIPQYVGATYTAGTGLTLAGGAFSVNTTQNITTLSNLSVAGFVKSTSAGLLSSAALASSDITTALGFTPYNATNPSGYISNATGLISAGSNVTITGSGTSGSPYSISSTSGGSSFAYPFPSNATSTLLSFTGGISTANASTTLLSSTGFTSLDTTQSGRVLFGATSTPATDGAFIYDPTIANKFFGMYSAGNARAYGISESLPAPTLTGGINTSTLGGYYAGLGIGGGTNNAAQPIFGVLTSTQSGNGIGNTAFTVTDQNKIYTYHNVLDDGAGNVGIGSSTPNGLLSIGTFANFTSSVINFFTAVAIQVSSATAFQIKDGYGTPIATFNTASTTGDQVDYDNIGGTVVNWGIDTVGHIRSGGTAPALSSCGTSPSIVGDDRNGTITTGTGATACTITFANAYAQTPVAVVSDNSTTNLTDVSSISTTAATFSMVSAGSVKIYYHIEYHQ
jgi:hypothetical protein